MNKLIALFSVFRKGQEVANPEAWKKGQITGSVIAGLLAALVALAKAFGYELPLSDADILSIGTSIVVIVGLFVNPAITIASTKKIGVSTTHPTGSESAKRIIGG
jgi:hypothetical protein